MSAQERTLLRLREVQVGYARKAILPAMSLDIRAGDFIAVLGANGAGKSTWFKTALGLLRPVLGRVEHPRPLARMSYVPQRASLDSLLPMTSKRVVHWGRLRGWSFLTPWASQKDRHSVLESMRIGNCEKFSSSSFSELSGGEQQRVLFSQLLASEAELVFLDEPTASMDAASEVDTYAQLARLCAEQGVAIVVITHSIQSAHSQANRFVFLDKGSGGSDGVAESGSWEQVARLAAFQRQFGTLTSGPGKPQAQPGGDLVGGMEQRYG